MFNFCSVFKDQSLQRCISTSLAQINILLLFINFVNKFFHIFFGHSFQLPAYSSLPLIAYWYYPISILKVNRFFTFFPSFSLFFSVIGFFLPFSSLSFKKDRSLPFLDLSFTCIKCSIFYISAITFSLLFLFSLIFFLKFPILLILSFPYNRIIFEIRVFIISLLYGFNYWTSIILRNLKK